MDFTQDKKEALSPQKVDISRLKTDSYTTISNDNQQFVIQQNLPDGRLGKQTDWFLQKKWQ